MEKSIPLTPNSHLFHPSTSSILIPAATDSDNLPKLINANLAPGNSMPPNHGPPAATPTATGQTLVTTSNGTTYYIPITPSTMLPLPPSPSISVRDYIYFLPYPLPSGTPIPYSPRLPHHNPLNLPTQAFEPTSTLVLTSPSAVFVDIRVLKPVLPSDTEELPNTGGPARRLEWAFGGLSSSFRKADNEGNDGASTHSVWSHWVDSKHFVGSTDVPVDEGDMYPLPDGRTLEHGSSFNSDIGKMHSYEEMWSDVDIEACFPSSAKVSVTLRVENIEGGVRGLVVRVGQFCQGILMRGNNVTVERWEFVEEADRQDNVMGGEWTRIVRVGDLFVPCAATFKSEELTVNTKISYKGCDWFVEEVVEWVN